MSEAKRIGRPPVYQWQNFDVGESMVFEKHGRAKSARFSFQRYAKRNGNGMVCTVRKQEDGTYKLTRTA